MQATHETVISNAFESNHTADTSDTADTGLPSF